MKTKVNKFLLILLSALMIQSCTITKRYHSLGFNIELNSSGNHGNDPSWKAKKGIASSVKNNTELLKDCPNESLAGDIILSIAPISGLAKVEKSTVVNQPYVPIYYHDKSHDNFQSNVVINKLSAPAPILPPDSLAINKIKNFGKTTKNMFFGGVALVGTGILLILLDPIKMFFGGPMTAAGVLAILLGLVLLTVVMWLALFYLIKKYEYNRYHDPKI
jgi:hypothetical protein